MFRKVFRVVVTLALVLATTAFLASGAEAAASGGFSMGSRGSRTFAATSRRKGTMFSASLKTGTTREVSGSLMRLGPRAALKCSRIPLAAAPTE